MNSRDNVMVLAAPMLLARDPSIAVMNAAYSLPSGNGRDWIPVHRIIPVKLTQGNQGRFLLNGFKLGLSDEKLTLYPIVISEWSLCKDVGNDIENVSRFALPSCSRCSKATKYPIQRFQQKVLTKKCRVKNLRLRLHFVVESFFFFSFTLLLFRVRQGNLLKCLPHVQHDYLI